MVGFFRKAGLSVLLRNGVFGGRIPLLTPRNLLSSPWHIINLYLGTQGLPNRIHHRPAEFMKHHPRGLIPEKTELTL